MKFNKTALQLRQAELGLNQTALAELTGISRSSLSTISQRGTCSPVILGKIARALGVSPADLVKEEYDYERPRR